MKHESIYVRQESCVPDSMPPSVRRGLVAAMRFRVASVLADGVQYACRVPGSLAHLSLVPGDHVLFLCDQERQSGELIEREERQTELVRWRGERKRTSRKPQVIAANIGAAVIVASSKQPDFHARFIDRYQLILNQLQIPSVLCLTKNDLGSVDEAEIRPFRESGLEVIETSIVTGGGLDTLRSRLHRHISILLGQSGVGKSALIQQLAPDCDVRVSDVNRKTGKGKHTTSSSDLFEWEQGSFVIDTPGIRSLGVEHIPREAIRDFFEEFAAFSNSCKFRNCFHDQEPSCAVRDAAERGEIPKHRFASYLRLIKG